MTTTQRARANTEIAIEHVIVCRSPRLPSDIALIDSIASLSFCPVASVERRERADHISRLIDSTIVDARDAAEAA
jgi:hypothetical protein